MYIKMNVNCKGPWMIVALLNAKAQDPPEKGSKARQDASPASETHLAWHLRRSNEELTVRVSVCRGGRKERRRKHGRERFLLCFSPFFSFLLRVFSSALFFLLRWQKTQFVWVVKEHKLTRIKTFLDLVKLSFVFVIVTVTLTTSSLLSNVCQVI